MAKKKTESEKMIRIANFSSVAMVVLMSAAFIFETLLSEIKVNYGFAGFVMILAMLIVVSIVRNSINHYKMAFNVPFVLLLFYTSLMMLCSWNSSFYLLFCFALCAISCLYSSFHRSAVFIAVLNILIGFLFLRGHPIAGHGTPVLVALIIWAVCLFGGIIMLRITRQSTIVLNKALEHQNSFNDLLTTTENYVAIVDERNEVVHASKTMSMLGNIEEPALVSGRPFIDLFPGKSLKLYAGKILKEKDDYAEDWEFSLNGQKRYFKAVSHSLAGSSGALINLYDMTHLAERDEIAAMKDSVKIGLFFMDKNYVIQDHYSRYLEEMLEEENLFGRLFTDVISDSVSVSELEAIKDYFNMILEHTYDQEILDDINPLNELHYTNKNTGSRKVFQCAFATVERDHEELFILVTVYDITVRVELQQKLAEEEARRQEEMQSVFELIKVEQNAFGDFMEDMEYEFDSIEKVQKDDKLSAHDALVKIYQSVHAIKSNAVILGLNVFGNKMHNLESKIKRLREMQGEIPFAEMLNLTIDIEKIAEEKDGFREIIEKLQSYAGGSSGSGTGEKQSVKVMIESLAKTAAKASEDMNKKLKFLASDIDAEAIDKGPRRVMKEILMQLIRNSAVHGVELPEVRKAKGKNETGIVKLSIKMSEDQKYIHMKLSDDGKGLDYKKIAQKAVANKIIKKEDAANKDMLIKAIFAPGFSTADTEGVHAGRGIGLNLVRDRIKEVNGTIKLRSEADKGTLFFVSLPVNNPAAKPLKAQPQ